MKRPLTDPLVRLAIVTARQNCIDDPQMPYYGALSHACQNIEHGDRDKASDLYSAAKIHIDQTERVQLLDAAIAALPAPEEMK